MKQNVATLLGLELSAVTFTFLDAPPSTMLTVQVNTASQLAASTARTTLAGQFNSAAAAANLLFGADSSLVEAVPVQPFLPPAGGTTSVVTESVLQLSGSLADFNATVRAAIRQAIATNLNVSLDSVQLTFTESPPSSVLLTVAVTQSTNALAAVIRRLLAEAFSTAATATVYISSPGITPTVVVIPVQPAISPPGGSTTVTVESVVQLAGTLSNYTDADREAMALSIANALNISTSQVVLSFIFSPPNS